MHNVVGFIGRHASRVLPLGVVIGILLPSLAERLQHVLLPALFVPLTLSLVRIKTLQLRRSIVHWQWVALLCAWILLLRPVAVWTILQLLTLPEPLQKAVLITAAAPPVTACAAIAIFLGIDAAIAVVVTVATMLLVPLSLPPLVFYLADLHIEAELWQVSLRLAVFILSAFLVAAVIKKWMGETRVHHNAVTLDGIAVICIGIFVVGVMHGVQDIFIAQPGYVLLTLLVSTLLVLGLYILGTVLFWRRGPRTALAIGLVSGNCNMGLMYLILADQAKLELLIFFAIGQVPMYFLPSLLAPLIDNLVAGRGRS